MVAYPRILAYGSCNQRLRQEAGERAWSIGTIEREIHIEASPEVVYGSSASPST